MRAHTTQKGIEVGWRSKGLGRILVMSCGCQFIEYPGGLRVATGCSEHKGNVEYSCPVCGKQCKTRDSLKAHRWQHGY